MKTQYHLCNVKIGEGKKQRKSRFNKNMFAYYEYIQNIYIFGKQHTTNKMFYE